jgi:hypothetical protein
VFVFDNCPLFAVEDNALDLVIRWHGGDHSALKVKKSRSGQHRWSAGRDRRSRACAGAADGGQSDRGGAQPRRQDHGARQWLDQVARVQLAQPQRHRSLSRSDTLYDPWHYVPVLARKPGALRNGAPFKDWVLPASMERVRRKLASVEDGNRQMVDILTAVLADGLPAIEAACAEAIAQGVHSADVVLNNLAGSAIPAGPPTLSRRADAAPYAHRRLCPLRQPQENHLMERAHPRQRWSAV